MDLKTKGCMMITIGDFWVEIQEKKTLSLWICQLSGDKDFYFLEESWQFIGQHRIHRQLLTNQPEAQAIELIRKHHKSGKSFQQIAI
jgi:hypothetical protein